VREQIFRPRLTWRRKAEVPEMISVKVEIPIDMKAIGLHGLNVQVRTNSGGPGSEKPMVATSVDHQTHQSDGLRQSS
jgi:hypothetical protein